MGCKVTGFLRPWSGRLSLVLAILLGLLLLGITATTRGEEHVSGKSRSVPDAWWRHYLTYVGNVAFLEPTRARMVIQNYGADPTWGLYGQHHNLIEGRKLFQEAKQKGVRWLSWIEGFGDCWLFAAGFRQEPDGSFPEDSSDPGVTRLEYHRWNWGPDSLKRATVRRWIGVHNTVNNEDFARPLFTLERASLPVPTYPDGRPATGWAEDLPYPLNARVYDACCSKDLNGRIPFSALETAETDPVTGEPRMGSEGLLRLVVGSEELPSYPNHRAGDVVYADCISLPKDLAAPFWWEYVRASVRVLLREGVDGVWCDNFSPSDNFSFNPVEKAFGDWSVYRFREFLSRRFSPEAWDRLRIGARDRFSIRLYLRAKAISFGARNAADLRDPAWRDRRWLDDPVWNAYKAFKQEVGQQGLRTFYRAIREEAEKAGRPDFVVAGNDIPAFGLGWVHDDWLDLVSSEIAPGWSLFGGSRGIMLPPEGKMAVVYRVALEHQRGPYATFWYYVPPAQQNKGELGKVLAAEAFANHVFLKYGDGQEAVGTSASQGWWNDFVHRAESRLEPRVPRAEVGLLFSPDCQLGSVLPGAPAPDFDAQPHVFGHWGWATALIEAHIPYRVIPDWKLNAEALAGLRIFILPDAECLEDGVQSVLQEWVQAGGQLIITGPAGRRHGPHGNFAQREKSPLASLVGRDLTLTGEERNQVSVHPWGRGTVLWTPEAIGMEYYLKDRERSARRSTIEEMVGVSHLLDPGNLPSTVGIFCWQSPVEGALFTDLVNYDVDIKADVVKPVENLTFRIALPKGWRRVKAETLTPDNLPPATIDIKQGWAAVSLPRLDHYAAIRFTSQSPLSRSWRSRSDKGKD